MYCNLVYLVGVGVIFDWVLIELVFKMCDMRMDKIEFGCLRVIILFNLDVKGFFNFSEVEVLWEKVYVLLEIYCK